MSDDGVTYGYSCAEEEDGGAAAPLLPSAGYVPAADEEDAPSWCQRLGGSCVYLLIGVAVVALSFPLLWGNEERYIRTWRVLDEASRLVEEAPCRGVSEARFGALVHVSCPLEVSGEPAIDSLGVVAAGAALLSRRGEMLQWEEDVREHEREGSDGHRKTVREYSYSRAWSDSPVDSSLFRYPDQCITRSGRLAPCHNPPWPEDLRGPDKHWARIVDAGDFRLTAGLRNSIPADLPFHPPLELYYGSDGVTVYRRQGAMLTTVREGQDAAVGDVRISYAVNSAETVSVLGMQAYAPHANATFAAYTTPKGRLFMPQLFVGEVSAAEMFQALIRQNETLTWLVRLGGWVLCWLGLGLCSQPLVALASGLPLLGGCLADCLFCGMCAAAGALSLSLSAAVVGAAWLFYRPLIAAPLLALAAALLLYLCCWRVRAAAAPSDQPPAAGGSPWPPPPTAYPAPQPPPPPYGQPYPQPGGPYGYPPPGEPSWLQPQAPGTSYGGYGDYRPPAYQQEQQQQAPAGGAFDWQRPAQPQQEQQPTASAPPFPPAV